MSYPVLIIASTPLKSNYRAIIAKKLTYGQSRGFQCLMKVNAGTSPALGGSHKTSADASVSHRLIPVFGPGFFDVPLFLPHPGCSPGEGHAHFGLRHREPSAPPGKPTAILRQKRPLHPAEQPAKRAAASGPPSPSGKLPFTFPAALEDSPAHSVGEYPGRQREDGIWDIEYKEGIFVGYRWFDKEKIRPLFAFGHGLSYTDFSYGKVSADSKTMDADGTVTVSIDVTNTGDRPGKEVVQLYISDLKSSLPRPVKELKDFRKISLAPGETETVTFTIDKDDLCFFDPARNGWVAEPGKFKAMIGSASDDIRSEVQFTLEQD